MVVVFVAVYFLYPKKKPSVAHSQINSDAEFLRGKVLAGKFCASCHMLPDPALLPKAVWSRSVLPIMGLYLGTTPHQEQPDLEQSGQRFMPFPEHPMMTEEDWRLLQAYYLNAAPEQLVASESRAPDANNLPFTVIQPKGSDLYSTAAVASCLKFDLISQPGRLLVNDAVQKTIYAFSSDMDVLSSGKTQGPVVDLLIEKNRIIATIIGKELTANDLKEGEVVRLKISAKEISAEKQPLFEQLARPLQVLAGDLNADGKTDYVVAEFGNLTGKLIWMENRGNDQYQKHVIREVPGAIKIVLNDDDQDGLPEIYALFAQADEGIFRFKNKGKGIFETERMLRFPPTYGSSNFELVDFNGDGKLDILYTCGDNADYSPVLKPYHGLYLYLNNGRSYEQTFFYPINGCYKALARDFDGDGDLDIAAISFFPAAAKPWEAFTYLQNNGNYHFKNYGLPAGTKFQKGITMDAADFNQDGKPDLVLGNGYFATAANAEKQPLFIYLKHK